MVCLSVHAYCVHAYMHTATQPTLRRSVCSLTLNRVLLAVGRETSGPASALRAPAGSGSDVTYHDMSHRGRMRSAQRQRQGQRRRHGRRACSTAASSAPGRYRPERRPQLRARAWDCGLSGSLCRPPAAAGATLLSRMAAGTAWGTDRTWCVKLRVSYESKVKYKVHQVCVPFHRPPYSSTASGSAVGVGLSSSSPPASDSTSSLLSTAAVTLARASSLRFCCDSRITR